jgi:RNA polymerase sigma-70 factor (ECF subfamily)
MWVGDHMLTPVHGRRQSVGSDRDADRNAAFQALAEQHIHEAYKLANAVLADPAGAQDAVHDSFVKAWERWSSLRDPAKFDSWFKRIVINTCRDRLREAGRHRTADVDTDADVEASDALGDIEERMRVEQALLRLKPDDRVLLALRYYRDLQLDDIAELLNVPTGTVKSRLSAAHRKLRSALSLPEGTA